MPDPHPGHDPVARRSDWWFNKFAATAVHLVARQFRRVCVLDHPPTINPDRPLIIASNHPSWWDPMVGLISLLRYFPDRHPYVPIDPVGMNQHPIMARVGFFPVEPDSPAGARSLLRHGQTILARPRTLLWITPEGSFTNPLHRPLLLKPGIARLAAAVPDAQLLPVAIHHRFADHPRPDALLHFGSVIDTLRDTRSTHEYLTNRLTHTLDQLLHARDDDPRWHTILDVPDATLDRYTRLLRAYLTTPRAYDPVHLSEPRA